VPVTQSAVPRALQSEEAFQAAQRHARQLSWTTKGLVDVDALPQSWVQKPALTPEPEVKVGTEEVAASIPVSDIEVEEVAGWAEACRLVVRNLRKP
jgi:hypothetical protein